MACLAKAGGKCWTTIRDSERQHLGKLTGGGTGSSNAPVVIFQRCFETAGLQTAGWITSHIDIGSGGRNHTYLTKFMRLRSVL